jgi:hypothetical protein
MRDGQAGRTCLPIALLMEYDIIAEGFNQVMMSISRALLYFPL